MFLESLAGGLLIVLGEEVPEASAYQLGKEPTGVRSPYETGPFSGGHKGQPLAVAAPNDPLLLCFFEQREQAIGLAQVLRNDVRQDGWFLCCLLCSNTRLWAACGRFLVTMFLKGFLVCLFRGWCFVCG
jgi:hypothetical protein